MRRLLLVMLLFLTYLSLVARGVPYLPAYMDLHSLEVYSFLRRTENRIIDKDSVLKPFWVQLRMLERDTSQFYDTPDKVSIVHIGDSHVQAGELTTTVRLLLQKKFGNAGRGLVVPLKIASSNEPYDYSIVSPNQWIVSRCVGKSKPFDIGLSGMAIGTPESTIRFTIRMNRRDSMPDNAFNTIRLFHHNRAPLLGVEDSLSIDMCCPDTTRLNLTDIYLRTLTDSVVLTGTITDSSYNTPIFYGFSLENSSGGVLYHSVGINSACLSHYDHDAFFAQQQMLSPNLFVVALGTNEAAVARFNSTSFRNDLDRFVKRLKQNYPHVPILLVTPAENYRRRVVSGRVRYVYNENMKLLREVLTAYADNHAVAYWDMYTVCGGASSAPKWYDAGLMTRDRVHYTVQGYRMQGMLLYEALMNSYSNANK